VWLWKVVVSVITANSVVVVVVVVVVGGSPHLTSIGHIHFCQPGHLLPSIHHKTKYKKHFLIDTAILVVLVVVVVVVVVEVGSSREGW